MLPIHGKYTLLLGHYGSGKTELALALAREQRRASGGRVALVDLDIVNPYFRSAEHKELLEQEGVEVMMPSFALSSVDVPSLPAQIQSIFESDYDHVVIDVGGDDTGAVALGRYAPSLSARREQVTALYVVNPLRPFSDTVEDIAALFALIESRARIRPDYLVNNANLQEETTAQDLIQAQELLNQAAQRLNVPVGLVAGLERLKEELPPEMQALFFPLSPVMKPEWLREDG
jgi:hypothetical protein